ncbi:MAG: hypothetical protein JKX73_03060 [Flavobacteriales bacterium]|nr:hypothetical protein [Flavobacteriales bacterium]
MFKPRAFKFALIFSILLGSFAGLTQVLPPPIQNISHKEYIGHTQIFCSAQDGRGVMYFGSSASTGILEYDGKNWDRILTEEQTFTTAMKRDLSGRIYVGCNGEFGFLAADSSGKMGFVSLSSKLKGDDKEFGRIWNIHIRPEGVVFQGYNKIYIWSTSGYKVISSETKMQSFLINGQLYVSKQDYGLTVLKEGALELVPGGRQIPASVITGLLALDPISGQTGEQKMLVFTQGDGIFIYNPNRNTMEESDAGYFKPLSTSVNGYLKQNNVDGARWLPNGNIAIHTRYGGLVIIDRNGKLRNLVDERAGLQNEMVWNTFVDDQNNLWLALNNGISRVAYDAPIFVLTEEHGFSLSVDKTYRYDGNNYLATASGVYHFESISDESVILNKFGDPNALQEDIGLTSWDFCEFSGRLLTASTARVYEIKNDKIKEIGQLKAKVFYLFESRDTSIVFVGNTGGQIYSIASSNGALVIGPILEDSLGEIQQLVATSSDNKEITIWMSTFNKEIVRMKLHKPYEQALIEKFDTSNGLPAGLLQVFILNGKAVIGTDIGLYRFNQANQRFEFDSAFTVTYTNSNSKQIFKLNEDKRGNVWVSNGTDLIYGKSNGSLYQWTRVPFYNLDIGHIREVSDDGEGLYWISGTSGIARYNSNIEKNYQQEYNAHIRKVISGDDTLFYGAHYHELAGNTVLQPIWSIPELTYEHNSITFHYSATFFERSDQLRFKYMLEGYEEEWSEWSHETKKEYTNLLEGDYIFHVRAKNVYEHESHEAGYAFEVMTPFYKSWWFYGMQIGFLLLMFGVSYRFGRAGGRLARVAPVLATVAIVILFEYFQNYIEDNFEDLLGGITFLKVMINVLLVFMLLPIEGLLKKFVKAKQGDE